MYATLITRDSAGEIMNEQTVKVATDPTASAARVVFDNGTHLWVSVSDLELPLPDVALLAELLLSGTLTTEQAEVLGVRADTIRTAIGWATAIELFTARKGRPAATRSGKTLGEMTQQERDATIERVRDRFQAELTAAEECTCWATSRNGCSVHHVG